jgi:hypothetical protein
MTLEEGDFRPELVVGMTWTVLDLGMSVESKLYYAFNPSSAFLK